MAKLVIHISEAEAASDFASLMARVRDGAEVVIEQDARPVAVPRNRSRAVCSRNQSRWRKPTALL
jgi:antitoxin (DNA-binding transcriptional repressor) of toxin-antitoxin stability system